jgi:dihydroorotase
VTQEILEEKYQVAAERSYANYSFMMGATNDNLEEVLKQIQKMSLELKYFWDLLQVTCSLIRATLEKIFSAPMLIVHCEDETTVQNNLENIRQSMVRMFLLQFIILSVVKRLVISLLQKRLH